jgi:hypothetical protein
LDGIPGKIVTYNKFFGMSLPVNNKNNNKSGKKGNVPGSQNSRFIPKPGAAKSSGGGKKMIKTGGSRGS